MRRSKPSSGRSWRKVVGYLADPMYQLNEAVGYMLIERNNRAEMAAKTSKLRSAVSQFEVLVLH